MSDLPFTDAPAALLAFRDVHDPQRWFPLEGAKTTVGCGLSCTLRMTDAGVRPLHCLITMGQEGLTVRRWSDGTLLNGEVFSESAIGIGDTLTIGSVELELVEQADFQTPTDLGDAEALPSEADPSQEWASVDPTADAAAVQSTEQADARAAHNRQRVRRLVERMRESRTEHRLLQASLAELEGRVTGIEAERSSLAHERNELAKQLETLADELAETHDAYTADRQAFKQRESELQEGITRLEQEIRERNELIEQLKDELLSRYEGPQDSASAAESTVSQDALEEAPPSNADHTASTWLTAEGIEPLAAAGPDSPAVSTLASPDEDTANDDARFTSDPHEHKQSSGDLSVDEHVESASDLHRPPDDGPVAPSDRWDIEVLTAADDRNQSLAITSRESATSETSKLANAEVIAVLPENSSKPGEVVPGSTDASIADLPGGQEDLWGRLQSLRSEACQKLHNEIDALSHRETTSEALLADRLDTLSRAVDAANGEPVQRSFDDTLIEHDRCTTTHDAAEMDETIETDGLETAYEMTKSVGSDSGVDIAPESFLFAPPLTDKEPAKAPVETVSFVEKYKHLLEEDGGDNSDADSHLTASTVAESAAKAGGEDTELSLSSDDESIEDYMAKMLARLRGESEVPRPTIPTPEPCKSNEHTPATAPTPGTKAEPLASLSDFKAASKPEQSKDISALRDLANDSAREAIKIANSRRAREMAYANLLMSLLAGSAGGYLIWVSQGAFNLSLFCGATAVAGAGYWACRTVVSLLPARIDTPNAEPSDAPERISLPIAGPEARPQ